MTWQNSAILTLAAVNGVVLLELLIGLIMRRRVYSLTGTLTNVSAYTVYLIIAAIYGYLEYLLLSYLQLAFATPRLTVSWWYWPLLILADDFCFYWFHRTSHKLGILWMSHVVHHSSNEFNFSVGLRQTWLPFLGILFWLPLAFFGFRPEHILLVQAASLTYQFLMHTQLINLPRAFGLIFNTPSHHRVHHGMNTEYIDRNFAGVLIIWDRLFRTFTSEKAGVTFGIHEPPGRGEILFAQLHGPWQFIKNIFTRNKSRPPEADAYTKQKTSVALVAFFLLLSLTIFAAAIYKPRWFI